MMNNLAEKFLQSLREKDASPLTVKGYSNDFRKFISWYDQTEGSLPEAEHISPMDIAEFKRHFMDRSQKPSTINRALSSLSSFFKWAIEAGYVSYNPAENIKLLSEIKSAPRSLERKESLKLIRAVYRSDKPRDVCIVTILLHTGIRVSELCVLRFVDVVIKERTGNLTVRAGKGSKYRQVPLNATVRNSIEKWLEVRGNEPGLLFPGRNGNPLSPRTIEYLLEKYSYEAKLEETASPHILRHTFCKMLIDAGESIDRVASLAGHENLNTTARYTRATTKDLQDAVDKLSWE